MSTMIEYPYCKSKNLTVRHIPGIDGGMIKAESVEAVLRRTVADNKQLRQQIDELRKDLSNIYDAQNG